jgi:hypothetical protein
MSKAMRLWVKDTAFASFPSARRLPMVGNNVNALRVRNFQMTQGVAKWTGRKLQEVRKAMRTMLTVLGVMALWAIGMAQPPSQQFEAYKGKVVPDFSFQDINGKKHQLSAYRGKVLLFNFWSPH